MHDGRGRTVEQIPSCGSSSSGAKQNACQIPGLEEKDIERSVENKAVRTELPSSHYIGECVNAHLEII